MKLRKIAAAIAAAAMAISMTAMSAFATTVDIDPTEAPASWSSSGKGIKKADLEAVGGDVKIVLTVETIDPYELADQFLVNPIDYDNGWISQTQFITSDTIVAKEDGWICVPKGTTSLEFVFPADAIAALGDSGLCFSCQNVQVKTADYELASAKQAELTRVGDKEGKDYCFGKYDPKGGAAADTTTADTTTDTTTTDAPAADATTTSAETGNAPVAVMVSVMAIAGAAAIASKKRN